MVAALPHTTTCPSERRAAETPPALAKETALLRKQVMAVCAFGWLAAVPAKARDEGELYLLIADEISDPVERKTFIRKAISVSGKP